MCVVASCNLGGMPRATALDPAIAGKMQLEFSDRAIAELAGKQHGVVARRQLLGLGLSGSAIDHRCDRGRLHRLHRGVYTVGSSLVSREGKWIAAVLASGRGSALSHHSAAALWGLQSNSSRAVEVTTTGSVRSRPGIRRHAARLQADEVTVEQGIPVTTVPRTLFDLAAVSSVDVVEHALRESEYLRLYDHLSLPDLLARYPGRPGCRIVRECLRRRADLPAGRVRSWLEREFLPFLGRNGLPRPQLNVWLQVGGRSIQVDCLWPERRAIVELDGFAGHGTRVAFREDRARDRKLRVAGYGVTRITPEQLDDEPEALAADLRVLLDARAGQGATVA